MSVRLGHWLPCQTQAFDVELNGIVHLSLHFRPRAAGGDATGQIRRERGEAGFSLFEDDEV